MSTKVNSFNTSYTLHCDESCGSSNIRTYWKIIKDKSHRVTSTQNVYEESASGSSKILERIKLFVYQAFLPTGYPLSVSDDYTEYQIWDTAQAFCSTLTSVLTTHAIMLSVGVGDESATALAAASTWIIKEWTGMMGRILFAWWKGTALDSDCKRWRIMADLINDVAMCIELLLPLFPQSCVVYPLGIVSIGKSIVGVAGGATRASITEHQARTGNIGDVAAKDGSQETCVNLTASILGLLMLKLTADNVFLTWTVFTVLIGLHIYSNYKAVSCLQFNTLNKQRFLILFDHYLRTKQILTTHQVQNKEKIFFPYTENQLFNLNIKMGSSIKKITQNDTCITKYDGSFIMCKKHSEKMGKAVDDVSILLKTNVDIKDILRAFCFAVFLDCKKNLSPSLNLFQKEIKYENDEEGFKENYFQEFYHQLRDSEWELSHLNHFEMDEWRYDNLNQDVDKEKVF